MISELPNANDHDEGQPVDQFTVLFREHGQAIYGHIRALVPHASDVEEVFQETSITLWQKFSQYQPNTDFRAWACRIAYYKVLQLRDRQMRSPRLFSPQFLDLMSEELVVMSDVLDAQTKALTSCREKLNQRDRRLLECFHSDGATAKSVARHIGRNLDYVYRAIRRIYGVLFDCIERTVMKERQR